MLPYKNPELPIDERVEDLLSRMTLEEKVAQLCGNLPGAILKEGGLDIDKLRELCPDGHGRFTQYSMTGICDPEQIAKISNDIQHYFVEETRLGIPVALQTENLCGYPAAGGTLFPAMINMGCTWEPELAEAMSEIIGQETHAVGISSAMSPVIDVSRDPRWGRTYETFGEDPYLISQFGINYVRGMQSKKVSCIAKHFLGYASTQGGLNTSACRMGKRELYEMFATPFEAASKEADLDAMMANYGEIDGLPVIDNPEIIGTLLRNTMGFKGVLTSDGAAVMKSHNDFNIGRDYIEAGYIAKKAGTDTEIPVGNAFKRLPEYVRAGKLDEKCIDDSCRRVLRVKFKCGLFENPYCDVDAVKTAMNNPEKNRLSKKIAAESLVLLKNNGILPLKGAPKIALVGPHADSLRYPVSGYTYPAYIEMMKAGADGEQTSFNGIADEQAALKEKKQPGNMFAQMLDMFSESDKAKIADMNTVLRRMEARSLKEVLSERYDVSYAEGCKITDTDRSGFAAAVKAAENSDIVVMACGGNCGWVNVTGGEGKDRQFLDLPGVQQELLEAVAATGKPVVLVLYGPQVFAVNWAQEHCAAIVEAFMPGQYAGEVISDMLQGIVNPGGKLTMSIPRTTGQIPLTYNHRFGSGYDPDKKPGFASMIFTGGYVDGPDTPLYHFGYGLSYTKFAFSDLELPEEVATDGTLVVSAKVTNIGDTAGSETMQLYTSYSDANVTRPIQQLGGFRRVMLQPGETKKVTFYLKMAQLGYYNENMDFVVEPGELRVKIGNSSNNQPLRASVQIVGDPCNVMGKRSYICETTAE